MAAAVRPDQLTQVVCVDPVRTRRPPDLSQITAELQVRLNEETGQATWVGLRADAGVTPSDLQRFPWATFLTMADAARRGLVAPTLSAESNHLSELLWAQITGKRPRKPRPPKGAER